MAYFFVIMSMKFLLSGKPMVFVPEFAEIYNTYAKGGRISFYGKNITQARFSLLSAIKFLALYP